MSEREVQPVAQRRRVSFDFKNNWWPAPVTLVSCGVERPNIWAVGVLGGPCDDPPLLTISPRTSMHSYRLIMETGQFVVNFPAATMVREMEYCGTNSGVEVDKWKACGFTPVKGDVVDVPLIAECPVNFECVTESNIGFKRDDGTDGEHQVLVGRIVRVHADEELVIHGELQWDLTDLIIRSRPRTWRTTGPVIGYDPRTSPLIKPVEAAELVAQRARPFEGLAEVIRRTPYPSQLDDGS